MVDWLIVLMWFAFIANISLCVLSLIGKKYYWLFSSLVMLCTIIPYLFPYPFDLYFPMPGSYWLRIGYAWCCLNSLLVVIGLICNRRALGNFFAGVIDDSENSEITTKFALDKASVALDTSYTEHSHIQELARHSQKETV